MFGIQGCSAIYDVTLTMLFRHIPPQFKLVSYYIGFCIGLICIYGTMYTYIIHGVACARLRCTLLDNTLCCNKMLCDAPYLPPHALI